jgi:hypothetical protein
MSGGCGGGFNIQKPARIAALIIAAGMMYGFFTVLMCAKR